MVKSSKFEQNKKSADVLLVEEINDSAVYCAKNANLLRKIDSLFKEQRKLIVTTFKERAVSLRFAVRELL